MTAKPPSKADINLDSKTDTRRTLLEVGMALMVEKGYTNTGIQEILTVSSIPKGSFYHYFESKENFAAEIIRCFDENYTEMLIATLRNENESPINRLKTFCLTIRANLQAQECRKGCLVGNLSQEMSDQSEVLRKELCTVMQNWQDIFAFCIKEGQERNEIRRDVSANNLAEVFLSAWSGAVMRAKTFKKIQPIDIFLEVMFDCFLR